MAQHNHYGHRQRLKDRFLQTGFTGFDAHGILELLLFYSIPQRDTNDLAHELVNRFGSLSGVFDASYEDLVKVKGISANTATLLKMIPQLANAYLNDRNDPGIILDSAEKAGAFLMSKYVGATNERIYLLCLDNKLNLLNCMLMGEGSLNKVGFHPRRILEQALQCSASAIILSHNHPHGLALPSNADLMATDEIKKALQMMKIQLIDHLIFAGEDYVSIRASAFLSF